MTNSISYNGLMTANVKANHMTV